MEQGRAGAEHFLKELVWREFAWHLIHHTPHITHANWRDDWDSFPSRGDNPDAERWRRGMTGEPFVDAAMREMYVTGTMHNRARMIAASYLTKHLMTHWKVGLDWFAECLTDWDPASNAMGWQWVMGSGVDSAPYYRIFAPIGQSEKFEAATYIRRWVPELAGLRDHEIHGPFERGYRGYPAPVVDHKWARERALQAYQGLRG
jgi:deoxyribodipyrimidine photo-lyase